MKISLFRKIDYWVGIPLCLLFSGLDYILKLFYFKRKKTEPVKKVLFIKFSELGAVILAYPLLKRIKDNFPGADLYFVTSEKNKGIFVILGGVIPDENIFTIRENSIWLFMADTFRMVFNLRKKNIDVVFDLEFFSRFSAILAYLSKAHKKIGFYRYTFEGLYRGNFFSHKIQYNPLNHVSKTYLSLSQVINVENKETPELEERFNDYERSFPKYVSEEKARERIEEKLNELGISAGKRIFLINPGEIILPIRNWPLENFVSLSSKILGSEDNCIVIIGTHAAAERTELILKRIANPRCVSLIEQINLAELMELFGNSYALISNDCGLAHLATLTSIKKFIIFGPESPHVFGPLGDNNYIIYSNWLCSPCFSVLNHRNSACVNNKCLEAITPENVYVLIQESLRH